MRFTRDGYYVEGRFYGTCRAQAEARARHLAAEYGRPVDVILRVGGRLERVHTAAGRRTMAGLMLEVGL